MASRLFRHYKKLALSGTIDLAQDRIYCMLVSGTYDGGSDTNSRTHRITGDIGAGKEVVGVGYKRGGEELSTKVLGEGTASNTDEAYFDAADVSWASSTITAAGAVIWRSGSVSHLDAHMIAYIDFGGNQTSTNGLFSITWNTEGIVNFA